jgi:hypothetical protein
MSRGYQPEEHLDPRASSEERETAAGNPPETNEIRDQASGSGLPEPTREPEYSATRPLERRIVYEIRGRTYRLRSSEIATMLELGKFRAVAREDLAEFVYRGKNALMRPDLENLIRQGLAVIKTVPHQELGSRQLLTLTKSGYRFLMQIRSTPKGQSLYYGFANPREAHHDADLYRLYQKAAAGIENEGGRNLRVVLDYELKKQLCRDLAKLGKDHHSAQAKEIIAQRHGLLVVRGKIPVPDIRIEYETRDGERARVELELATGHYRGRNLSEKVRAGFSLYAHAEDVSKLKRVLDEQELTAEILSL